VGPASIQLTGPGGQVTGQYNTDAAGGTASFTPGAPLAVNTQYSVNITTALKDANGNSFAPFSSTFTTGSAPPPLSPYSFTRTASTPLGKPTVLAIGPDGKLYAGTAGGSVVRYPRNADGTLGAPESVQPWGSQIITGLAFDPSNPLLLYVVRNVNVYDNAPRMSGKVSTLTLQSGGPLSAATAADVIVGLPRSMHDHMTNGIAFGPDGKLYIAQGANTAYGDVDPYWGTRGESPLSASVLVADVHSSTAFPPGTTVNVNTDPVGTAEDTGSAVAVGYDAAPAAAPVRVFAPGVRNAYSVAWAGGSLYAPVNESAAGGNTPAGPGNNPPGLFNVQAYNDYVTRIESARYYGHPNPAAGYFTLNGGNPTNSADPNEVTEYPVGVTPDPNWRKPDLMLGVHRSPDGVALYGATAPFSGALAGQLLVTEYSNGDDLLAVRLDASGNVVSAAALSDAANPTRAISFNNPLGVTTDPSSGVVYVSEYGDETNPADGLIDVLTPGSAVTPPPLTNPVHINFQPASAPVPTGYTADTGAAFTGTSGWQTLTGSALDLSANTRDRNSAVSPDQRYDTLIHMQAPAGSGTTTPGRWQYALASAQYDVTVAVGDATATNSVYQINAEAGTANAITLVDHVTTTSANPFFTTTKRVTVSDGFLTLDPTGGTNTKLDFVDIAPVTGADTTAPTATVTLSGTQTGATTYSSDVQVTVSASDNVGVTSLQYSLDGGPLTTYSAPFTVTTSGGHTVAVIAKDAANNQGTANASFTIDRTVPPPPTSLHVNFASQGAPVPSGYTADFGQAFDATRGSGWEADADGTPLSLVGNGRDRNDPTSPDQRYDTFIHMQLPAGSTGVTTPGRWEASLANGTYNVTVAVGDASATNSVHRLTAEPGTANSVTLVYNYTPTSAARWFTSTTQVTVSDGRLTISPAGGSNTKIDFVDAVPAGGQTDTTPPSVSVSLAGPTSSPGVYTGDVTVTVNAQDEAGGSGLASVTYSLDGGAATPYTAPFTVTADGSHTLSVTAKDVAGNTGTAAASWSESHPVGGTPQLSITTPDDVKLGLDHPAIVFSAINSQATPARSIHVTNTGSGTLTLSNPTVTGTNSGSFKLASGQPTSWSLGAGQSADIALLFTPTAPTNCPTSTNPQAIGNVERYATLGFTSNAAGAATVALSGVNACDVEGNNEPVFSQIVHSMGYTTQVYNSASDTRFLGPARNFAASDEIQTPYFTAADASQPVRLSPVAHYSGRNTASSGFARTGWYLENAPVKTPCATTDGCQQLYLFAADQPAPGPYVENQKMMPNPTGVTTFTPTGPFGLWNGDFASINFTDDAKNIALDANSVPISPPHYLHDIRVYKAFGPGRVLIPNTYIVGVDITRTPSFHNNDYQDIVFILRNAKPELAFGPQPGDASLTRNLASGGTVSASCAVTGFTGVLPNTAGNQCNAANIAFTSNGLALTSTAGQMGGSTNAQQNALYNSFDASRAPFRFRARVLGPVNYLTQNFQQVAAWFGPDQDNYVKVEAEHNGLTGDPHLTMFYEENGVGGTVSTVSLPGLTSASTLDLIIQGNTSFPDPTPAGSDPNSIRNYPLDQLAVFYSLNGGTPVQVGTVKSPADVMRWFSTVAKAGILVSGGNSTTPFTSVFSTVSLTAGPTNPATLPPATP